MSFLRRISEVPQVMLPPTVKFPVTSKAPSTCHFELELMCLNSLLKFVTLFSIGAK